MVVGSQAEAGLYGELAHQPLGHDLGFVLVAIPFREDLALRIVFFDHIVIDQVETDVPTEMNAGQPRQILRQERARTAEPGDGDQRVECLGWLACWAYGSNGSMT